jgi:hypothetical protein
VDEGDCKKLIFDKGIFLSFGVIAAGEECPVEFIILNYENFTC